MVYVVDRTTIQLRPNDLSESNYIYCIAQPSTTNDMRGKPLQTSLAVSLRPVLIDRGRMSPQKIAHTFHQQLAQPMAHSQP